MLVIFEGQGRTGKTTAVRLVHDRLRNLGFNVRIVKFERSENPYEAMMEKFTPLAYDASDTIYLLDRGHLTELAYSIFKQREVPYSAEDIFEVDAMLALHGALMIFFSADPKVIRQRHIDTQKEPDGDPGELDRIYTELITASEMNIMYLDTTCFDANDTADFITLAIRYQLALQKGQANEPATA